MTSSPSSTYFDVFRNKRTSVTGTDHRLNTQPRFVVKNRAINCLQHPCTNNSANIQMCMTATTSKFCFNWVDLLGVFTSYFLFPPACVNFAHPSIRLWRMLRRRLSTEVITSARQPSAQLDCCWNELHPPFLEQNLKHVEMMNVWVCSGCCFCLCLCCCGCCGCSDRRECQKSVWTGS